MGSDSTYVGRDVNHPRRGGGEVARAVGVDPFSRLRLGLGLVDVRIRGAVDDHVRPLALDHGAHRVGVGDV
jgi:hypothetical protein